MLKLFDFDMYALLDPCANLSFDTPFLAIKFDVSHKILSELVSVYTLMEESGIAYRVYQGCLVKFIIKSFLVILLCLKCLI